MSKAASALNESIMVMLTSLLYFLETDMAHCADSQKTAAAMRDSLQAINKGR